MLFVFFFLISTDITARTRDSGLSNGLLKLVDKYLQACRSSELPTLTEMLMLGPTTSMLSRRDFVTVPRTGKCGLSIGTTTHFGLLEHVAIGLFDGRRNDRPTSDCLNSNLIGFGYIRTRSICYARPQQYLSLCG